VRAGLNYVTTLAALICLLSLMGHDASAITAEVARKCGALTDNAYPLRVPGNPAAGRTHGTAETILTNAWQTVAR
jgi:hypothetical protein